MKAPIQHLFKEWAASEADSAARGPHRTEGESAPVETRARRGRGAQPGGRRPSGAVAAAEIEAREEPHPHGRPPRASAGYRARAIGPAGPAVRSPRSTQPAPM